MTINANRGITVITFVSNLWITKKISTLSSEQCASCRNRAREQKILWSEARRMDSGDGVPTAEWFCCILRSSGGLFCYVQQRELRQPPKGQKFHEQGLKPTIPRQLAHQFYSTNSKIPQLLTYTGHKCQCLMISLVELASDQLYPAIHVHYHTHSQCHTWSARCRNNASAYCYCSSKHAKSLTNMTHLCSIFISSCERSIVSAAENGIQS